MAGKKRNEQGHRDHIHNSHSSLLIWSVRHNLSHCGRSEIHSAAFMTIGFKYSMVTDGEGDGSVLAEGGNEVWMGLTGSNRAISLSLI